MDKRSVVFAQFAPNDRNEIDMKLKDDRFSVKRNSRMTTSDSDDDKDNGNDNYDEREYGLKHAENYSHYHDLDRNYNHYHDSDQNQNCDRDHDDKTIDSPYSTDSNYSRDNDLNNQYFDMNRMITTDTHSDSQRSSDQNTFFTTLKGEKKSQRTFFHSIMQALYMMYHN